MAGEDEARARAVLAEMQMRISQGPESALGLGDAFSAEDVRAKFLSLTKQFHPARFGRLSGDLQRMSNEVFLGIKSAHETMLKILGAPTRPMGNARPTGGMPPISAEGTSRTPSSRPTGAMPRLSSTGTTPPATQLARGTDRSSGARTPPAGVKIATPGQSGPLPRSHESGAMPRAAALTPSGSVPLARQPTPAPGTQTSPLARPTTPTTGSNPVVRPPTLQPGQTSPLARQPTPAPGQTSPVARQTTPTTGQAALVRPPTLQPGQTSPLARQSSPAIGQPPLARQGTPAPGQTSPIARPGGPPAPQNFNPPTQRGFQSGAAPTDRPSAPPAPSSTNFNVATQRGVATSQPQPTQPIPKAGSNIFDETASLNEALMFLEQRNWTAARQALHALAAKIPQSKPYRALLCYSRGREAHAAGRNEEALLEYQRALQLDPALAEVKQAVAELQRRR